MKRQLTERMLMVVMPALFLMISPIAAQIVSDGERQFREAQHKQLVEGDLNGAVKIYQSLIAAKTTDGVVKAKALLQLAVAFEALGKESEAVSVYERIVRDFADQSAGTRAKERLKVLHPRATSSTMTMRKIEFGESVRNVVATDGQKAVYWDDQQTTLYFGD